MDVLMDGAVSQRDTPVRTTQAIEQAGSHHQPAAAARAMIGKAVSGAAASHPLPGEVVVSLRLDDGAWCSDDDLQDPGSGYWMTPFQLPSWRQAWQKHLGTPQKVRPVTAILHRAGRTIAILPLAIHHTRFLKILTWHAAEQSDYGAPILCPDEAEGFGGIDAEAVLRQIATQAGGVDLIHLPKQPLLVSGVRNPLVLPDAVGHHVGAHAINFVPGETWDAFLTGRRSASSRQQLRKKARLLEKMGKVEFRVAGTVAEAGRFTAHCLAAKSRQLARLGHHDIFAEPEVRDFVSDHFSHGVGRTTWAAALMLDEQPIATAIGFARPGEWLLYQMAMDRDHVDHVSPGTQLLMRIMQHCMSRDILRLDLALGDEAYKFDWCDEHVALATSFLPLTLRGSAAAAGLRLRAWVLRKIAADPRLYDLGKSLKRRAKGIGIPV